MDDSNRLNLKMNVSIALVLLGSTTVFGNILPTFDGTPNTPSKLAIIGGGEVWIAKPGHGLKKLATPTDQARMEVSWSPNGKKLVYIVAMSDIGPDHLWTMNEDGSDHKQITFGEFRDRNPHWMLNGLRILFNRSPGYPPDGRTVSVSVSNRKLSKVSDSWEFAESPNRMRVAVHRKDTSKHGSKDDGLWLYDPDLKPIKSLARSIDAESINWVDDQWIWCQSVTFTGQNKELIIKHWLFNAVSRKQTCLASTEYSAYFALSPDHRSLASIDNNRLAFLNLKTHKRTILDANALGRDLMWSTDSKWIYYQKLELVNDLRGGIEQLWMLNPKTGQKKQLSFNKKPITFCLFDKPHHVAFYWDGSQLVIRTSPSKSVVIPLQEPPFALAPYWGKSR